MDAGDVGGEGDRGLSAGVTALDLRGGEARSSSSSSSSGTSVVLARMQTGRTLAPPPDDNSTNDVAVDDKQSIDVDARDGKANHSSNYSDGPPSIPGDASVTASTASRPDGDAGGEGEEETDNDTFDSGRGEEGNDAPKEKRGSKDSFASSSTGSYAKNALIVNSVESALRLHDEITATLIANNVDRFDKYSTIGDPMTKQALENAALRNRYAGHLRFTPGYWHGWTRTRNILERSSEKRKEEEEAEAALIAARGGRSLPRPRVRDDPSAKKVPWRRQKKGAFFGDPTGFQSDPVEIPSQPSVAYLFKKQYNCEPPPYPEKVPYDSFSKKGALFGTGSARVVGNKSATTLCTVATVSELLGPMSKKPAKFGQSTRFDSESSRPACPVTTYVGPGTLETPYYQSRFSVAERFAGGAGGAEDKDAAAGTMSSPNPGTYNITRMFDDTQSPKGAKAKEAQERTLELLRSQRALRESSSSDLAQVCTFAYGCNLEEHRQYGVCLDGMCGRRAQFEDVILLTNKDDVFKGTSPNKMKKLTCRPVKLPLLTTTVTSADRSGQRVAQPSEEQESPLPTAEAWDSAQAAADEGSPKGFVSPMQAAIIAADFSRIKRLVEMGYNINEVDSRNGYTVVHHLVFMRHTGVLFKLLKEFAEKPEDVRSNDASGFGTLFHPGSVNTGTTTTSGQGICTRDSTQSGGSGAVPPSRGRSSQSGRNGSRGLPRKPNSVLKIDCKDMNGDTAIHIAARMGMDKVVTMLCDYSIRPVDVPNNAGEFPSMIAKNHSMYQLIKVCEDRIQLDSELRRVQQERAMLRQRRQRGPGSKSTSRGTS